ncbi:MAG: hypothetical protein ABSH49_04035 [Bryobacteraceae bacterium]
MRVYSLGPLVLLISAALPPASAVPVNYILTGYVQVSAQGQQVNTAFVWTVTADTAGITNPSPGHFQNPATSNTISFTGVGQKTALANVSVYLNTTTGQVTFGSAAGGIGLTNSQLTTWDLASPIGPLNGANFLVAGTITTDTGTAINLNGVANTNNGPSPTFQASQPPPTISSVVNAASNILPGLPNAGIAQGAIFLVYGMGLGPANIAIAQNAFQSTSLSNTSVAVTVNGTTVNALMYYTSAGQVSALLPSNTPTGTGTITVTYNGRTGDPAPITVVPNNVGIFTVGSNGQGPAIVTYPDYSLVSPTKEANCGGPNTTCGAANPGDTLILWATGLGPVSGSDASGAGLGQNMPTIPLQLWLGGVQAPVVYQGRSGCCIGEDQIVFTVPNNLPTGCAVPLLIQIGNQISNATIMPVAASGSRSCTGINPAVATAANAEQLVAAGPVNYADISVSRDFGPPTTPPSVTYSDNAKFQFVKILGFADGTTPFAASYLDDQPLGTCNVYNSLNPASHSGLQGVTAAADAGSSFTIMGPNGSKVLAGTPGQFNATLSAAGTFLSPGAYTITGVGGTDIHAFTAPFNIPAVPVLTNPANLSLPPVTRSSGLTVTWTGGASDAYVQIQVQGPTDNTNTNGATAVCNVAASAGTFTIPPYALLALPASSVGGFQFQQQTEAALTATGLDLGVIQTSNAPTFIGGVTLR